MNQLKLLIAFSLLSFALNAQNWSTKRLEKLYKKDANKCISVAKKHIKLFPDNPASYYYVSVVYFDQVDDAQNLRGEYVKMGNALVYARKFEKVADEEAKETFGWDEFVVRMEEKVTELVGELQKDEMTDMAENLRGKLERLENIETIEIVEVTDTKKEAEVATVPITSRVKGQYYGLPTGEENIPSYNLSSEQELLKLINEERVKQGMEPLEFNEDLARAARYHAYDLATQNYFDHDSYDRDANGKIIKVGGTFTRIRKFYNATFVNSENIAGGNQEPGMTYYQWFTSKGHYENMFNKTSKQVGIGVVHVPGSTYDYYWVFCTAH